MNLKWCCTDCSKSGIEQRILLKVLWYSPIDKKYNEELICLPCLKKRLNETEPTLPIESIFNSGTITIPSLSSGNQFTIDCNGNTMHK